MLNFEGLLNELESDSNNGAIIGITIKSTTIHILRRNLGDDEAEEADEIDEEIAFPEIIEGQWTLQLTLPLLKTLLKNNTVSYLKLIKIPLPEEAIALLAEIIHGHPTLMALSCSHNGALEFNSSSQAFLKAISHSKNLKQFDYTDNAIDPALAPELATLLIHNHYLLDLDISNTYLDSHCLQQILAALTHNTSLIKLKLLENRLRYAYEPTTRAAELIQVLALYLPYYRQLKQLHLSQLGLVSADIIEITSALKHNIHLLHFGLEPHALTSAPGIAGLLNRNCYHYIFHHSPNPQEQAQQWDKLKQVNEQDTSPAMQAIGWQMQHHAVLKAQLQPANSANHLQQQREPLLVLAHQCPNFLFFLQQLAHQGHTYAQQIVDLLPDYALLPQLVNDNYQRFNQSFNLNQAHTSFMQHHLLLLNAIVDYWHSTPDNQKMILTLAAINYYQASAKQAFKACLSQHFPIPLWLDWVVHYDMPKANSAAAVAKLKLFVTELEHHVVTLQHIEDYLTAGQFRLAFDKYQRMEVTSPCAMLACCAFARYYQQSTLPAAKDKWVKSIKALRWYQRGHAHTQNELVRKLFKNLVATLTHTDEAITLAELLESPAYQKLVAMLSLPQFFSANTAAASSEKVVTAPGSVAEIPTPMIEAEIRKNPYIIDDRQQQNNLKFL